MVYLSVSLFQASWSVEQRADTSAAILDMPSFCPSPCKMSNKKSKCTIKFAVLIKAVLPF